ncbi:MAG: dipicolinate synthase subunit B [Pygmaiobacter massiliensis]|nr:dipicolinate synthase subunit B [Pygmaiobacter massiliensis]
MEPITIGYAMCGSFCTFEKSFASLKQLRQHTGARIIPIQSFHAAQLDTRFGKAEQIRQKLRELSDAEIIDTIQAAEPIGPKKMCDILVVAPCTGNTLAKLACGITDTPVTMACKSHLRCGRPVVLAVSTNDALAASAQNIGRLMNTKNLYFVPMFQDDPYKKPSSLTADYSLLEDAIASALSGRQLQPVYC